MEWGDRDENDYRLVPGTYMTVNEYRRSLGVPIYQTGTITNASTTTGYVTASNTVTVWPTSYGDAYFMDAPYFPPAKPAKVKKERPETEMQWLKRRISEVSWVPV